MNRRRFIWQKAETQSGLPEGYTAVDYLQASGAQWINTETTPSQDTKVIIKFMANDWGYASLIGGRATSDSNDQFTTYLDSRSNGRFLFRMDGMSSAITYYGIKLHTVYIAEFSGTKWNLCSKMVRFLLPVELQYLTFLPLYLCFCLKRKMLAVRVYMEKFILAKFIIKITL